jgi:hypothetical protein
MLKPTLLLLVALCVSLVGFGIAQAGVPCPDVSTVVAEGDGGTTPDAVVCPAGDFDGVVVTVTAIDCFDMPVPDMPVTVYPDPDAVGFCFCPGEDAREDTTDAAGVVTVVFARFGGCGELSWHADGRGVIIGPSQPILISSPDNFHNDCDVNLSDFVWFAGHYQGADPCCDYNGSGTVNLTDFIAFASHYTHSCE